MANILVTGVAGFLGSNLTDRLISQGHDVVGVDNFCTGNNKNIEHLKNSSQFSFFHHDISKGLADLTSNKPFEFIYHMASPASPPRYMALPLETMWVNTVATEHLLEYSKEKGSRLLFASTSEIYGDPHVHPQKEDYWGNVNPIGPRSIYDEAKRYGETLLALYRRQEWADTAIIRIFNTYGPRLDPDDGRVVSSFLRDGILGKPLPIFGDGTQTRSFCFVDDLISGIIATMESGISGPVNLGNPNEFKLLELVTEVAKVLEIEPNLEFMPLPEDDPKMRRPDISYAKEALNWEPKIQLPEGLAKTAEWMKQTLGK